jgi:hypothetical protein
MQRRKSGRTAYYAPIRIRADVTAWPDDFNQAAAGRCLTGARPA